jgi:pSer/pThr/pTyr-binding forkhead associated (FHA) protein
VIDLLIVCLSLLTLLVVGFCLLGTLLPVQVLIEIARSTPRTARRSGAHVPTDVTGRSARTSSSAAPTGSTIRLQRETVTDLTESSAQFRLSTENGVFLLQSAMTIGRSSRCAITLSDSRVSRRHARLSTQRDAVLIEDLGSMNGTTVNGEPVHGQAQLRAGDLVSFGGAVASRLECSDETVVRDR